MSTRNWSSIKSYQDIKFDFFQGIAKITINRPQVYNAFRPETNMEMLDAMHICRERNDINVVVLTGAGDKAFCSGGDQNVKGIGGYISEDGTPRLNVLDLHKKIRSLPKPVIAMVNGYAIGGGHVLHVVCDLTIAADNAKFVMAYSSVGLSPDGGGSWALARALPRATAMKMLMAAQPMTTPDLRQLGVVSHAAAPGQALQTALNLAKDLCARAPNVLASIKELVNDAADQTLSAHLAAEQKHFVKNLHHPNGGEGIRSFMEKRTAHYK